MALPSFMSVHVQAVRPLIGTADEDGLIIQGSGFVLSHGGEDFLITNGHIVTGRERKTDKPIGGAALPKQLELVIPIEGPALGSEELAILGTKTMKVDLYGDTGKPLWYVHPIFGRHVDVVALPLKVPAGNLPRLVGVYLPYKIERTSLDGSLEPPDELSIIGFPYGLRGGAASAIWVRGNVATEPDFAYEGESCFLVDARTRDGQSGSPVIRYIRETEESKPSWQLLGVYSSRVADASDGPRSSDLGRVWTTSALSSVVEGRQVDSLTYE